MERSIRRRRQGNVPAPSTNLDVRVQLEHVDINDLVPYEFNPRKNEGAVASLANSIKSFGFLIPVVVDGDNILVAGHTRVEAAKRLGLTSVPAVRATHLTEAQINAFRLIDNKVAELAEWDFDMLAGEIGKLQDSGIDFVDFGWSREEIDCLGDMVSDDCLSTASLITNEDRERIRATERRAPATARFVCGELVFFIPISEYTPWVAGIRDLCNYDEAAITQELQYRLGMRPRP